MNTRCAFRRHPYTSLATIEGIRTSTHCVCGAAKRGVMCDDCWIYLPLHFRAVLKETVDTDVFLDAYIAGQRIVREFRGAA